MSAPLKDFRGKITPETWVVLEAMQRTDGRDHSEIVRDVLHKWALQQLSAATVMTKLAAVEGIEGMTREG